MSKQKVVIKISMSSQKCKCKAMKIAVSAGGVESVAVQGEDKDQLEVTGENIDAAELTNMLRKKIRQAELVSVGPVKKEEKKPEAKVEPVIWAQAPYPSYYGGIPPYCVDVNYPHSSCTII